MRFELLLRHGFLATLLTFLFSGAVNASMITVDPTSSVHSGTWVYYYYGHENQSNTPLSPGTSGTDSANHSGGISSQTTFDLQQSAPNTLDYSMSSSHTVPYGGWARSITSLYFNVDSSASYDLTGFYYANGNRENRLSVYLQDVNTGDLIFSQNTGPGTLNGLNGTIAAGDYLLSLYTMVNSDGQYSWNGVGFGPVPGGADQGNGEINFSLVASVPEPELFFLFSLGLMGIGVSRRIKS